MKPLEQYQAYPVPVAAIYYDVDFNCRGEFTLQSVKELADSVAEAGRLICPVAVQPWTEEPGFEYRLIVGHRRFKAVTTFLKWTEIPAYVCEGLSDHQARMLNLVENLQRKSLNILEEAHAIQRLYPNGVTVRQAAQELKQHTRWVWLRMRLLRMPEAIQQKAAAGLLLAINLETLAGIESADEQVLAAGKIVEARQRGKGKFLPGLNRTYKRRRGVRPREEINRMVERMLAAGIDGLPPRVAAWCAGRFSDEELWKEIEAATLESAGDHAIDCRGKSDEHTD
ncbi:MAG: ParB/RepB/Spo0J family partition protein [Thermoguttaceae bacterium]|jgi:ParB/RepB/Spo0J family partition protein